MNFIFISPNFPHTYWQFCDRLKKNGVNVLGIGDAPYDELEEPLKAAITRFIVQWRSLPSNMDGLTGSNP